MAILVALAVSGADMHAQQPSESVDTNYFIAVDASNFDSLLHAFYMRQYAETANRHVSRRATQAYAEFDDIPDSVFIKRLHEMHTVIPLSFNADVRAYIKVYVRIMSRRLEAMLSLSEYYFPVFEEILDRYGVPEEMKYLTIVESALNPHATSRAGAAGLWQFMYATGKAYDLEVNSLVDERRDPYKSTVAAARYLASLHSIYNDWILAMAAYNCGPGNVNKAMARSGGKSSFWEIFPYLPRETRRYVPAFIGAAYVMNYYHEHGLSARLYELPLKVDTLHLHRDVHLSVVEQITGIPAVQLRQLNPQYRTDIVPASSRTYSLTVPTSLVSVFLANEDSIYKVSADTIMKHSVVNAAAAAFDYYKVKRGDTFTSIAKRHGVSVAALKRWNGMGKNSTLKVGSRLKIYHNRPATDKTDTARTDTAVVEHAKTQSSVAKNNTVKNHPQKNTSKSTSSPSAAPKYYTVKKGDNLSTVASRNGVTVAQLKKMNNLKTDKIMVGQKLRIK